MGPPLRKEPLDGNGPAARRHDTGVGFAAVVLFGWIVVVPIAGYLRFDRTDL